MKDTLETTKPWPCDEDWLTWEAHRNAMGPDTMPPYDEADASFAARAPKKPSSPNKAGR
jgi:hypothetical protein